MEREEGFERPRRGVNYLWQDAPLPFIAAEPFAASCGMNWSWSAPFTRFAPCCATASSKAAAKPFARMRRAVNGEATTFPRALECKGAPVCNRPSVDVLTGYSAFGEPG
jgi:hypothetical protein